MDETRIVNWRSLGLVIKYERDSAIVDLASFRDTMTLEKIQQLLNLGLYFYSPVHHVTLDKIEDFEEYVLKYN